MKVNVVSLILIIIVTLIIGGIAGYVLNSSINNEQKVEETAQNLEETQIDGVIENTQNFSDKVETVEYDGSKNITIDGKTYTVSYASEKFENNVYEQNVYEQTEVKLYLNDKKVKTLNLGLLIDVNHEFGSKDYGVELYTFCEEYILIVVKNKFNNGEPEPVNHVRFCIINTNGEHIDTLEWDDATRIHVIKTGEELTYEINNDSLILYEMTGSSVLKREYTVKRDYMNEKLLEIYDYDELTFAGK